MSASLMKHQVAGAEWLLQRDRAMLAWDMRLGKTATALRAWEEANDGPVLVLCPATARENWRREALRFCRRSPSVQVIDDASRRVDAGADVVVTNYDKLQNPHFRMSLLENARRGQWGALILDEAHYLKTPGSHRTKHVLGGKGVQAPLISRARRVWELTGTPMPNHPGELWTHCFYLFPQAIQYNGHTMAQWEFEVRYCVLQETDYGVRVVGGRNLGELKRSLSPYVQRLREADVWPDAAKGRRVDVWPLDVGGIRYQNLPGLVAKLQQVYGDVAGIDHFDAATLDAYLVAINAERDALATVRRETATLKAVAVSLLVREELENEGSHKTIVFAHHRDAIETLAKGLASFNPAIVHGSTAAGNRQGEIDRFSADPLCRVFIGQIQAAGQAIDLSAGSNVVFVEASWTPGENAQAAARAIGPRQTRPVWVRFAYLPRSIDENVMRANARKTKMINEVLGS